AVSSECTVLFADITNSTSLYESQGDEVAFALIKRCIDVMSNSSIDSGGRVVKSTGDGIMVVFQSADAAADAAIAIHHALRMQNLPQSLGLGIHVGFQYGPVVESENDVFGDTVNIAARLSELSAPGKALTSRGTAIHLSEAWQPLLRAGHSVTLKGMQRPIEVVELLCEAQEEVTAVGDNTLAEIPGQRQLHLYHNGRTLAFGIDTRRISIGRDPACDLVINSPRASRRHADIERRADKFVLVDRSSNGTYVTIEGESEFLLRYEEVILRGHGWLTAGQPRTLEGEAIEFVCV
ncbi:MAG: adenylate/guanylate cyclase domain-containing protein, partial [Rhodocyclaceae bacterium]|nr:adenylate/guanylate cyclase domain-containing protein [Rhodocyclaceae bacterium]